MNNETIFWAIFSIILGLISIVFGIWTRLGGWKIAYFALHSRSNFIYGIIPAGIAFVLMGSVGMFPETATVIFYIAFGFLILSMIFYFSPPSFMKPVWLRELEWKYGDFVWLLKNDANEMGLHTWRKRVRTQEDLETWAEEVRQKYEQVQHHS